MCLFPTLCFKKCTCYSFPVFKHSLNLIGRSASQWVFVFLRAIAAFPFPLPWLIVAAAVSEDFYLAFVVCLKFEGCQIGAAHHDRQAVRHLWKSGMLRNDYDTHVSSCTCVCPNTHTHTHACPSICIHIDIQAKSPPFSCGSLSPFWLLIFCVQCVCLSVGSFVCTSGIPVENGLVRFFQ